ncbi:uncharacterized protein PV07_12666 [Cladophialophora immunda]|uniref:F-box domain-containing protein n=1 Tax=Cladophialophora immunda TaxID=569365 RepID=A0A0D2BU24_9EURO|nr:uncharacterized protein PV07_12666 [Cladophialophora immunda]KIW21925.1 hypothetical protein PV07_12666 [Cladophialophora immunda]
MPIYRRGGEQVVATSHEGGVIRIWKGDVLAVCVTLPPSCAEPNCIALDDVNCYVGFSEGRILALEYGPMECDTNTLVFWGPKNFCDGSVVDLSIFQDRLIAYTSSADITISELSRRGDPFASGAFLKLSGPKTSDLGGHNACLRLSYVRVVDLDGTAYLMAIHVDVTGNLYVFGTEWPCEALTGGSCSFPQTDEAGRLRCHWRNLPTLLDPDDDSRWMEAYAWAAGGRFELLNNINNVLDISHDGVVVIRSQTGGWIVHLLTWQVEQYDDIVDEQKQSISRPCPPACVLTCERTAPGRQYGYVDPEKPRPRHQTTEIGDAMEIGARLPFKDSPMGSLPPEILLLISGELTVLDRISFSLTSRGLLDILSASIQDRVSCPIRPASFVSTIQYPLSALSRYEVLQRRWVIEGGGGYLKHITLSAPRRPPPELRYSFRGAVDFDGRRPDGRRPDERDLDERDFADLWDRIRQMTRLTALESVFIVTPTLHSVMKMIN